VGKEKESKGNEDDVTALIAAVGQRKQAVDGFLRRKAFFDALNCALSDPPVTKNSQIKDDNARIVEQVLSQIPDAQVQDIVSRIENPTLDVLMKYVYRFLSVPRQNTSLFVWHAAIVEKAGQGSIIRAMTDKKTV